MKQRIRIILAALGLTAGLAVGPSVTTAAGAVPPQDQPRPAQPAAGHDPCTGQFLGDARLGPKWLPHHKEKPVGPLLRGWHRTGRLSPAAFLAKYWQGPADTGSWKYPPNDGFREINGTVDKHEQRLRTGELLDRFGSVYGGYLAPAGDPYAARSLPPQSLNTAEAVAPCNYHVYEVEQPFDVWQGGIAPWFEQPGEGQQIKLDPVFLDPGTGQRLNVKWLLDHDYLEPADA